MEQASDRGSERRVLSCARRASCRIEVIRGPAAASYGANAFLGVINILSRSDAGGVRMGVMAAVGQRSYRELSARVGALGDAGQWRLSVGQRADDYDDGVPDDVRDPYADGRGDWRSAPPIP